MTLELSPATEGDAETIASIHLAAFDSNVLLHAQFPTSASLQGLHTFLKQETIDSLRDPTKAIVAVRENQQLVGFAKWDLPSQENKTLFENVTWPQGACEKYLDQYVELAEAGKERVVGSKKCYRLTFVATHPDYQGRGIGTLLTQWGLTKAEKEGIPVYLESTISASTLYRKLGFIAMDGFSMKLPGMGPDGGPYIYEEICMIRNWDDESLEGMDRWDSSLNISSLRLDYEAGIKPQHVIQAIYDRIEAYQKVQSCVWIHLQPLSESLAAANEVLLRWPDLADRPPLWGVPFSVKDSIDVAGIPTTIGCPALAFTPENSATVYQHCIDAGAIFIGKTNMEQLATGMTGCRSPYGTLHSTFNAEYAVGGSSSGSAVSVSEGLASFSIGSDTAGSIRIPAAFNGVVGFKPTKGTISAKGVAPACLHQDCVSILATTTEDAETVWRECDHYDKEDIFAKSPVSFTRHQKRHPELPNISRPFRFAVPPPSALEICSPTYALLFAKTITAIFEKGGGKAIDPLDFTWEPFAKANDLLYNGSFVLERLTTLPENWFEINKHLLHPVTREVFESALARDTSAVDVFRDLHKQAEYKRAVEDILTYHHLPPDNNSTTHREEEEEFTILIVPTAPFHPTISEVEKDPIGLNTKLGSFAHFANVLDLCAIAVPAGTYEEVIVGEDGGGKVSSRLSSRLRLPFGITILAGCGLDQELLSLVRRLEEDVLVDLDDDY